MPPLADDLAELPSEAPLGGTERPQSPLPEPPPWPPDSHRVSRALVLKTLAGTPWDIATSAQRHRWRLEECLRSVEELNERLRHVHFEGMTRPVFHRSFIHSLSLDGRFYTRDEGSFSWLSRAARAEITMDGEPVAEVDVAASGPTIFYALAAPDKLDPEKDLYAIPGLSRDTAKAFMVTALALGFLPKSWGHRTPKAARRVPIDQVRKAVMEHRPEFTNLTQILPPKVAAALPGKRKARLVCHYINGKESEALVVAMRRLAREDVVALPLHDGLVVAQSKAEVAREVVEEAFAGALKVRPRVVVKGQLVAALDGLKERDG